MNTVLSTWSSWLTGLWRRREVATPPAVVPPAESSVDMFPRHTPLPPASPSSPVRGEFVPPPGVRLPRATKVAYRTADLLAQQAATATHDIGLQQVLDAILAGCWQLSGDRSLRHHDLEYVINFSDPGAVANRRYSVRILRPESLAGQYDLVQELRADTLRTAWRFGDLPPGALPDASIVATPGRPADELPPGREARVITLEEAP